jgi:hypothetical protein
MELLAGNDRREALLPPTATPGEALMDSSFNSAFTGRHVTILSSTGVGQERTDTGTLVAMESNWIQLAKDNGEMLLFPSTAIRVIKLLDVEPPYSAVKEDVQVLPIPPSHTSATAGRT